jgi:hypothetical protein
MGPSALPKHSLAKTEGLRSALLFPASGIVPLFLTNILAFGFAGRFQ